MTDVTAANKLVVRRLITEVLSHAPGQVAGSRSDWPPFPTGR
jgi:hypothetical protein